MLVAPLMSAWATSYTDATLDYAAVGEGTGTSDISGKTVDFGAFDAPLDPTQQAAAPGLLTIPETGGALVPTYNLPGVTARLNFTGQVLAEIYLGNITAWNNSALADINPGVSLPNETIDPVHRSDAGGATLGWTRFLSDDDPTWASEVGSGIRVVWPSVGSAASQDSGMLGAVDSTPGAIGYLDLSYALGQGATVGAVENPSGDFVQATLNDTESAIADSSGGLPAGDAGWYNSSVLNAPGADDYPIALLSYLVVYQNLSVAYPSYTLAKAVALVCFLDWAISSGQNESAPLYVVPIPSAIRALDQATIDSISFNGSAVASDAGVPVTFSETGLPTGQSWSVTLGGRLNSSASAAIGFWVVAGNYSFDVGSVTGYHPSPASGTIGVVGSPVGKAITFDPNSSGTANPSGGPAIDSFTFDPSSVTVDDHVTVAVLVTGGAAPLTYSYRGLPGGCPSVNLSSWSCAPNSTGVFPVEVIVTDSAGRSASANASLSVGQAPATSAKLLGLPASTGVAVLLGVAVAAGLAVVLVGFRVMRRRR